MYTHSRIATIELCIAGVATMLSACSDARDPAIEASAVEKPAVEKPAVEKPAVKASDADPLSAEPPADCKDLGAAPTSPPSELVGTPPEINGVDVSIFQGEVPWKSLRTGGLRFVLIKATQGTDIVDPAFQRNWAGAKACGIPRAAYHLFDPSQDASEQANDFLAHVGDDHGELPAALDIELPYDPPFPACEDYVAGILHWATIVEGRTGRKPILYFQSWFYADILCGSDALKAYPLWAAGDMSPTFEGWPWTLWQHGDPGTWAGRQWDRDRFAGDEDGWQAFLAGPAR